MQPTCAAAYGTFSSLQYDEHWTLVRSVISKVSCNGLETSKE